MEQLKCFNEELTVFIARRDYVLGYMVQCCSGTIVAFQIEVEKFGSNTEVCLFLDIVYHNYIAGICINLKIF